MFGCVCAEDDVARRGSRSRSWASASIAYSIPLPGPSSPQVRITGRRPGSSRRTRGAMFAGAPCWITSTRAGSTSWPASSRVAGDLALDDDVVARRRRAPRRSGAGSRTASRARCGARRSPARSIRVDSSTMSAPSAPAEEPELVLDDHRVEAVENASPPRASERREPRTHSATTSGAPAVSPGSSTQAHDADPASARERPAERRGERREPAPGRRKRADEPDRTRGDRCPGTAGHTARDRFSLPFGIVETAMVMPPRNTKASGATPKASLPVVDRPFVEPLATSLPEATVQTKTRRGGCRP